MSRSASKLIEGSVKEAIKSHFGKPPYLIAGVSGGADSMALLYLLKQLKVKVHVVHINYGLRGKDSDLDQELVEGMAFEWGMECCSVKVNREDAEDNNLQNWARNIRYSVFSDMKEELSADAIAVAHHQDDQVETILQKVLRGSGPAAWQGMREKDGDLFRPLLAFTKQDILSYCEENGIPFREDESNKSSKYARNLLRNDVAPLLDALIPGWRQNVLDLPEKGRLTETALRHIYKTVTDSGGINTKKFSVLEPELKKAIVKIFIGQNLSGTTLSKGGLEELSKIEELQVGRKLFLTESKFLFRDRTHFLLGKQTNKEFDEYKLTEESVQKGFIYRNFTLTLGNKRGSDTDLFMDASKINWPVYLRYWKRGDRFVPFGMVSSQKISDHLTHRKVASINKEKALILCGRDGTIYTVIFNEVNNKGQFGSISELVKCSGQTKKYLVISFK